MDSQWHFCAALPPCCAAGYARVFESYRTDGGRGTLLLRGTPSGLFSFDRSAPLDAESQGLAWRLGL